MRIHARPVLLFLSLLIVFSSSLLHASLLIQASSEGMPFKVELVTDKLEIPWGMAFISTDSLLITERKGTVKRLNVTNGTLSAITGIPEVFAKGQGGLLDITVSPDYASDGWLYFTYSKAQKDGAATTLARAQLKDTQLTGWQDLLVSSSVTANTQHFGSRITFDKIGHVFFGIGDRGERDQSQDLMSHTGTIIRLKLDGSVPSDNPFIGRNDALPEIWSYGHRNPQGLAFDHQRQILWEIEHGPRGGDEINIIRPGLNYGWPVISYGKEYWGPFDVGEESKAGMEQPVKYYVPSIAPGNLIVYQGKAFPKWQGDLFTGALAMTHLNRIQLDARGKEIKEERLLENLGERIRSLAISEEGFIYLGTDSGKILRITPTKQ
jgi:glucose/arabinose dehydrogenase